MHTHKWQQFQLNAGGQFNFSSAATGNGFADFLMGFASSYSEPASVDFVHISTNNYNLYAMDDWRISNRLTLNLGLRWEGIPHAYDTEQTASNFYPNLYNPAQAAHLPAERRFGHERSRIRHRFRHCSVEREILPEWNRHCRTERNSQRPGE